MGRLVRAGLFVLGASVLVAWANNLPTRDPKDTIRVDTGRPW